MKILIRSIFCIALTAIVSFAQGTVTPGWDVFHSSTGFSVQYPATWFRKGISKDRLMILSSTGGAEAVIIKPGQAVISVMKEVKYENSTLTQLVEHYTQGLDVLSRTTIRNENAGNRGCGDLQEIVSREDAVPAQDVPGSVPHIINTELFCEVNRDKYATVLRNFEGDKNQATYQEIALRVAESLRTER